MILLGRPVAEKIYSELNKTKANLAVVLVGEDPVSLSYVKAKEKKATELGFEFKLYQLSAISTEVGVKELICDLNQNKYVDGIVIQLPLPQDFNTDEILKEIKPEKDIDGFLGMYPYPTAQAILEIFKYYDIGLKDKHIVIVGRGRLVGKPLENMMIKNGLKPIICDRKTENLAGIVLKADVLISATGTPSLIKPEMVNENCIVIDAGSGEIGGNILGDVDKKVYEKVQSYSPVPGGVGPVTVACLMRNLVEASR